MKQYKGWIVRECVEDINVDILLFKDEDKAFALLNIKKDQVDCGVVLDLQDIMELCFYLHKRFKFYNFIHHTVNKYDYDNFF